MTLTTVSCLNLEVIGWSHVTLHGHVICFAKYYCDLPIHIKLRFFFFFFFLTMVLFYI